MSDPPALDLEAIHRHFADQVRALAAKKRIPLYRLAESAGLSEVTLHRLLSGLRSPRLDQVGRLAHALGCRPSRLLP